MLIGHIFIRQRMIRESNRQVEAPEANSMSNNTSSNTNISIIIKMAPLAAHVSRQMLKLHLLIATKRSPSLQISIETLVNLEVEQSSP